MAAQSSDPSASVLLELVQGHRISAVLHTAAELGIADLLFEGPMTPAELAHRTEAHEPSLRRLMRSLVTMAICTEAPDGSFHLTEVGTRLAAQSERSLKAWVLMEGELLRPGWSRLTASVRGGKTNGELAGVGPEQFEVMARTKAAALFDAAMVSMTRLEVPAVIAAYDFSGIAHLMDVGGGLGQLMSAILTRYPAMRGSIFDLPHCAEGARKNLAAAGLADRCEFIGGNFFESVPAGADAIIMKSIIHDWNDERCVRVLRNCRQVLQPGSRVMLIDRILPEQVGAGDLSLVLDDLNMMRGPGGCERRPSEFSALLEQGGFNLRRVVPTGRYSVIEAAVR